MKKLFFAPATAATAAAATVVAIFALASLVFSGCAQGGDAEPDATIELSQYSFAANFDGDQTTITVTTNYPWRATVMDPADTWVSFDPAEGPAGETVVTLTAVANPDEDARTAEIRFTARNFARTFTFTQGAYFSDTPYADKEMVQLQQATVGDGVDILFMGDGFTMADMERRWGKYEKTMRAAAEHFFSVYPFSAYREYFNVWMIVARSNQEGISIAYSAASVDNRFQTTWDEMSGSLRCNTYIVEEYAQKLLDQTGKSFGDISIIIPLNYEQRAGSCQLYDSGKNISLCGIEPESFRGIVVHEGGGHGFGKLADEYIYFPDQEIPAAQRNEIITKKSRGFCANLDLTGDITKSSWAEFAGKPGYESVGMFEGGYTFGKGVWRPEQNSLMNDEQVLWFNAPSRWDIVRRIMRLSGQDEDYTVDEFMADDERPPFPAVSRVPRADFVPLGPTEYITE